MHDLLNRLLQKRKVKSEELSIEEKADFDRWHAILAEGEITVDKIKQFCQAQLTAINNQFKNLDNSYDKTERLVMLHTVYSSLLDLINSPQTERENLEKYLNNLLER